MEEIGKVGRRWVKRNLKRSDGPIVRSGRVVQTLTLGSGKYVQRYVPCGKGCSRCTEGGTFYDSLRPGHGPYWYWERTVHGRKIRQYVGVCLTPDFLKAADVPALDENGEDTK